MKKFLVFLTVFFVFFGLCAQPVVENNEKTTDYIKFKDSCGREVEIPVEITKIAPSGAVATMFCTVIAPEYMTNVNSGFTEKQMEYLPSVLKELPVTGQLYGSKATINYEELIATGAQVLVDIGDYKKGIEKDLDSLQKQIGIPCIFLSGKLEDVPQTFRKLGSILYQKHERAEELALFAEKTLTMAKENALKVKPEEKVRVMFSSSSDGLGTNAKGSSQAQVIELVGAENAITVEKVSSKGGGNIINMEQLYLFDPDVIIFNEDTYFDSVSSDSAWAELKAVKQGRYYEIPGNPYCWMGNPPSINMFIGIWWFGNLIYPQYFNYDVDEVINEIYNLFWGCDFQYNRG